MSLPNFLANNVVDPKPPEFDVEFFWDPVCPWAWITSRWVTKVAAKRNLSVNWRFISLAKINQARDYAKDFPPGYPEIHGTGLKLLRVAASIRAQEGPSGIGQLYTQFGSDIHVKGRSAELVENYEAGFPEYLASIGIDPKHIAAANSTEFDEEIAAETAFALSLTGKDVGTPIIAFNNDGQLHAFFGPVLSRVPNDDEALALWDSIWQIATFDGFAELKRSLRSYPQLDTSLE